MSFLRRVGAGATLVFGWAAAASCASVLGLDGFQDAADNLCAKLEACEPGKYPDCRAHVSAGLDTASASARGSWLALLGQSGALDSCAGARLALDALPICHDPGATCALDAHCCGFTGLSAKCDASSGTASCCKTDGAKCASDLECCVKICTDDGSGKKSCGGKKCAAPGEGCKADGDCCSMNCDKTAGKCALGCVNEGASCTKATECCTQSCGVDGKCACIPDGQSCASPVECCSKVCNDKGKCETKMQCAGFGETCSDAASSCCATLECGDKQKCCRPNGGNCTEGGATVCCKGGCDNGACCSPLEAPCTGASKTECCRGSCTKVETLGVSLCCAAPAPCGTSPCNANPAPLQYVCAVLPATDPSACIKEICKEKPACCCSAWSSDCAQLVIDRSKKNGSACFGKCATPV